MAFRYRCTLDVSVHCVRGRGKGPGKCPKCGGPIFVQEGVYGVFTWRGDGRYRREDAHAVYQVEGAAERKTAEDPNWVVRFI